MNPNWFWNKVVGRDGPSLQVSFQTRCVWCLEQGRLTGRPQAWGALDVHEVAPPIPTHGDMGGGGEKEGTMADDNQSLSSRGLACSDLLLSLSLLLSKFPSYEPLGWCMSARLGD